MRDWSAIAGPGKLAVGEGEAGDLARLLPLYGVGGKTSREDLIAVMQNRPVQKQGKGKRGKKEARENRC